MKEPIIAVSVSLTPDLKRRIDEAVGALQREFPGLRVSRSSVVRSVLLRWMDDTPAPRRRSRKPKE